MEKQLILETRNVQKTFPGVRALKNINLKFYAGEIHALIGENGAGKSTLMNVLSGTYPAGSYSGEIYYDGKLCQFKNQKDSEAVGIVIIHQELALIPLLSIGENMFLGNEIKNKFGFIDWNKTYYEAEQHMKQVGLNESAQTLVKDIGTGKQQQITISGSTALSVWLPGQEGTALQNSPSGGSPRRCATYLLLVTDETGDGQASRLALTQEGQVLLTGTSLELPQAMALDEGLNLVETDLDEVTITSREELGEIEDGVYTAGDRAGTDTLRLRDRDRDLEGTAQLHVVDALTSLTISRAGESGALTALTVEPGEQIQLTATGSYWGREALREWDADVITWTSEGDVGTVDDTGLYTAPEVPGEGSLTFTAGGISQTISVSPVYVHSDVTKEHWAYTAVEYCYAHGIVTGVSSTEFGRDNQIRRGDFMLMLYNALGRPAPAGTADFSDVSPDAYYYTALSWAQHAGLASGTGEGLFSPDAPITREQAFTILRQALPLLGKDCPDGDLSVLDQFSDRDQIAEYALGHTATLVEQGLVSGKGDGVDPRGNLTRAEMAAILYQAITFTPAEQPGEPTAPTEPTEPTEPADPTEPEDPVRPTDPEEPADPDQYALTLDVTEMILTAGDATTLTASVTPEAEGAAVTWTSSDPAAAAVAPDGTVTCLYTGTEPVFVTVTASWRGLTAQCAVLCAPGRPAGTVHDAELGLNIRSGPGTDQTVIGSLADGDQVVVLEALEGWYRILFLDEAGQAARGYVSADYLTVSE